MSNYLWPHPSYKKTKAQKAQASVPEVYIADAELITQDIVYTLGNEE